MARLPLLNEGDPDIDDTTREFLVRAGKARGRVFNIYRAMANHPPAASSFAAMANTVYRGTTTLSPKHGELAYLTATVTNNCYY